MDNISLLVPLHNLASSQDENFLTEVLAYILIFFSIHEKRSAIHLMNLITDGKFQPSVEDLNRIGITTQINTSEGRPDIKIETKNYLIYVEVKVDSDFRHDQLKRYKRALSLSQKKSMLITLSRYHHVLHNADISPDFGIRWHQLSDWLSELNLSKKVSRFVTNQFIILLKKRGLAMNEISWQLQDGVTGLINLVDVISEALAAIKITKIKKSPSWYWRGYYIEEKFFVGIYFDQPNLIIFNSEVELADNLPKEPTLGSYEGHGTGWQNELNLYSEEVHFFSRSKTSQLECLEKFLKESFDYGQTIIKKS